MTAIGIYQLKQRFGIVRRTMRDGGELAITFHHKPIGVLMPYERRERERAELEQLRAEVEALRAQLGQAWAPSAAA